MNTENYRVDDSFWRAEWDENGAKVLTNLEWPVCPPCPHCEDTPEPNVEHLCGEFRK